VSRLVECNCDNRLKRPDRDRVKQRAKLLIHLTRCVSPAGRLDVDVGARPWSGRGTRLFLSGLFRLADLFAPICF
jgi:hypothetical protein